MKSRERVLCAIDRKDVDQFPFDFGGPMNGISKIAYDRYLTSFFPKLYPSKVCDKFQQLACLHESLLKYWKVDTRHISAGFEETIINEAYYLDAFGVKHRSTRIDQFNEILYYNQIEWPLEKTRSIKSIDHYNWPELSNKLLEKLILRAKDLSKEDYAVFIDPPSGGIIETVCSLVSFELFIKDLYEFPDFFKYLIESVTYTYFIPYWEQVLSNVGEFVDIVMFGDDYGIQDRMLISPKMWRSLVKSHLKAIIDTMKKYTDAKLMLHSCGSIAPIIPDLIEIGFDILNPVQPRAVSMNHTVLKEKFGRKICFHGGIDVQQILPFGNTTDVQNEIKRVFSTLGANNTGYIFSSGHNILADVPVGNIHTLFSASRRVNSYF